MDTLIASVSVLARATSEQTAQILAYTFLLVAAASIALLTISSKKVDEQKAKEATLEGKRFSPSFPPESILTSKGAKLRRLGLAGIGSLIVGFVLVKLITGESL